MPRNRAAAVVQTSAQDIADAFLVAPGARRVARVLDEAVALKGVSRPQLMKLLAPPAALERGALVRAIELNVIDRLLPLLAELRQVSDDELLDQQVDALVMRLVAHHSAYCGDVSGLGFGSGRGVAHVPVPLLEDMGALQSIGDAIVISPTALARAPWFTEQARRVYEYVRAGFPNASRKRGLAPRRRAADVRYHQDALKLTARLMSSVYAPILDTPLTANRLKSRLQSRDKVLRASP